MTRYFDIKFRSIFKKKIFISFIIIAYKTFLNVLKRCEQNIYIDNGNVCLKL